MPTLLALHGVAAPPTCNGRSLLPLLEQDGPGREAALYGMFGAGTNITDGRYTYFLYPEDMTRQQLYEYTLMPMHLKTMFQVDNLSGPTLAPPSALPLAVPVLKLPARRPARAPPTPPQGHA